MRGKVRPGRGAMLAIAAGLLLLAAVITGTAVSQEQQTTAQTLESSCVTCHLDADMLEETMAAGAGPAKSPLQAGAG